MDRIDAMRLFVRIVETGSFTRAANESLIPRATATYAIQQLEQRLHVRLLDRTTREVRPTDEGRQYYERCVPLLQELDDTEAALALQAGRASGRLRVDLHGVEAREIVLPRIGEFHARHPDLHLTVGSGDRLVDLVREGVDCVVRAGEPQDSSLVTRRIARMPQVTCASPGYIAERGMPQTVDELLQHGHRAVNFLSASREGPFPFEFTEAGVVRAIQLPGWISVNAADSYVVCCEQGAGLVQVPRFSVERQLNDARLVEVLPRAPCPPMSVSALVPHRRLRAPRVRVFVDWVSAVYAQRFGDPA